MYSTKSIRTSYYNFIVGHMGYELIFTTDQSTFKQIISGKTKDKWYQLLYYICNDVMFKAGKQFPLPESNKICALHFIHNHHLKFIFNWLQVKMKVLCFSFFQRF